MVNLLDKFQSEVVGSAGRLVDFTSVISSKGDFSKLKNLNVILQSWSNILNTPTGSYTWDPEYGSDLYKYVFEPADQITSKSLKEEIRLLPVEFFYSL